MGRPASPRERRRREGGPGCPPSCDADAQNLLYLAERSWAIGPGPPPGVYPAHVVYMLTPTVYPASLGHRPRPIPLSRLKGEMRGNGPTGGRVRPVGVGPARRSIPLGRLKGEPRGNA